MSFTRLPLRSTWQFLLFSRSALSSTPPCAKIRPGHDSYHLTSLSYSSWTFGDSKKPLFAKPFQYRPLDSTVPEIRMLTFLPQPQRSNGDFLDEDGKLCFTLSHVPLNHSPYYYPLSYAWGDPKITKAIKIDGHDFDITLNLWTVLSIFCSKGTQIDYPFWIDAICINQADDVEKSQQVKIMHQIYQGAGGVTAWLGEPSIGDTRLHRVIWDLRFLGIEFEFADLEGDRYSTSRPLEDIAKFFDNPFWGRIWIVQELASATMPRLVFAWGTEKMLAHHLVNALKALNSASETEVSSSSSPLSLHRPNMMLNIYLMAPGHYSIDKLLRMFGANAHYPDSFHATDPRDMIFALLNISSDASALGIVADYSLTTEEVYIRTTETLIRAGKLGILSLSGIGPNPRNLPSWVPDFSLARTRGLPEVLECFSALGPTGAAPSSFSGLTTRREPEFQQTQKTLQLSGFRVDIILETGREMLAHQFAMHYLDWVPYMKSWFKDFEEFLYSNGISKDVVQETGALWKVPIADVEGSLPGPTKVNNQGGTQESALSFTRASEKTYESYLKFRELLDNPSYVFEGHTGSTGWLQQWLSRFRRAVWGMRTEHQPVIVDTVDITGYQSRALYLRYQRAIWRMGVGYKPFITTQRHIGFGPETSVATDLVVIFSGATTPYIIREVERGVHKIVGVCYIHGLMDGKFFETNPVLESFTIQ